jgi:hypothetical protein
MKGVVGFAAALAAMLGSSVGIAVAQDATPMAAKALAQEFAKDKAAAIQKYSGKTVLLRGTIGRINLNQFGTATMILDGQYIGEGLGLWLKPGQDARSVAVGQTVTLRCDVQKNNDVVQNCVFVR